VKIEKLENTIGKKEIVVQQFICPYCRSSVYMPEKKRK